MSCSKKEKFAECELNILRTAVDKIEDIVGRDAVNDPRIKEIIEIVEDFLRKKKLICYGGTAINNILPEQDQFYDKSSELPDYDFFSPQALEHAKELANIYFDAGFDEVEAKAGVHYGTFKVFVNFIPIADITQLVPEIYNNLKKDAIKVDSILYCPPNYLRMSMYLELSRPKGDVSRWEKVLKRLTLLNKNYPVLGKACKTINIQRLFSEKNKKKENKLFFITHDTLINQGVVFFGALSYKLYSKFSKKRHIPTIPDFDVLSKNPEKTAIILKERLEDNQIKNVKIIKKQGVGEVIATHYEVRAGKDTLVFIYEPLACHSYNTYKEGRKIIKVATIDTMLSFYLAFLYTNRPYYDENRILCMAHFLFEIQQYNRLKQEGILKRFGLKCFGEQQTIGTIRGVKSDKYKELKNKKNCKEYDMYFLRFRPIENVKIKKNKTNKVKKSKTKKNKTRKKATKKVPFTE